MKKFLIGQLACFGDCLYATTVAKQIKQDYPGCHITWAIGSKYKSVLYLNPHVDKIWEIPVLNNNYYDDEWKKFEQEANLRKKLGLYDELILTQIPNSNWMNYDGTIRSSTFNGYKSKITVSVDPVIHLSKEEVKRVHDFAVKCQLSSYREVILIECSPGSGQSFMNLDFALALAQNILAEFPHICFILSTYKEVDLRNVARLFQCNNLSYRENAELTKYCSLLIGCSSGITWLSTSTWSRKLDMIQLLSRHYPLFAGVKYDFKNWNLDTSRVIEITRNDVAYVSDCLRAVFNGSFLKAKLSFDEEYVPDYHNFAAVVEILIKHRYKFSDVFKVIRGYSFRNPHLEFFKLLTFVIFYSLKKKLMLLKGFIYTSIRSINKIKICF